MESKQPNSYDPEFYWEKRLSERLDITSVGHAGLGRIYNSWLYKARFQALRQILRSSGIGVTGSSVVELGVGSGAWIPFWQSYKPASLTGVDITSTSVKTLAARYPQFEFVQSDLGVPLPLMQHHFDIVTAFDVLFHIVSDASFSQAIANMGTLAKVNGWIIIGDSFCAQPWGPYYHEYHRSYEHYVRELQMAGLTLVHIQPVFFTMTTTVCPNHKALDSLTRLSLWCVSKIAARRSLEPLNHIWGLSLYLVDSLLAQVCKDGPSLKLLIARKAS
jgi:ubiquinone/menaquinone biosynthesis C-methylase UbiE